MDPPLIIMQKGGDGPVGVPAVLPVAAQGYVAMPRRGSPLEKFAEVWQIIGILAQRRRFAADCQMYCKWGDVSKDFFETVDLGLDGPRIWLFKNKKWWP